MPPRLTDNDAQPDYHQPPEHDSRCRNGWIGGRNTDTPIPCLTCKPHLAGPRTHYGAPHPRTPGDTP